MPFYKDTKDQLHFLESEKFEYLLPEGCVGISDAVAAEMQTPVTDQVKAAWSAIKVERDRRQLEGGVKVNGHWFLSTERATSEYNTIVTTMRDLPADTLVRAGWRTMDGALVDMTPALALQILTAGIAQRCAIDDAALAHQAAMLTSPDPAAYDYSQGWPEIYGE